MLRAPAAPGGPASQGRGDRPGCGAPAGGCHRTSAGRPRRPCDRAEPQPALPRARLVRGQHAAGPDLHGGRDRRARRLDLVGHRLDRRRRLGHGRLRGVVAGRDGARRRRARYRAPRRAVLARVRRRHDRCGLPGSGPSGRPPAARRASAAAPGPLPWRRRPRSTGSAQRGGSGQGGRRGGPGRAARRSVPGPWCRGRGLARTGPAPAGPAGGERGPVAVRGRPAPLRQRADQGCAVAVRPAVPRGGGRAARRRVGPLRRCARQRADLDQAARRNAGRFGAGRVGRGGGGAALAGGVGRSARAPRRSPAGVPLRPARGGGSVGPALGARRGLGRRRGEWLG